MLYKLARAVDYRWVDKIRKRSVFGRYIIENALAVIEKVTILESIATQLNLYIIQRLPSSRNALFSHRGHVCRYLFCHHDDDRLCALHA